MVPIAIYMDDFYLLTTIVMKILRKLIHQAESGLATAIQLNNVSRHSWRPYLVVTAGLRLNPAPIGFRLPT
jgi:hypothetical protein